MATTNEYNTWIRTSTKDAFYMNDVLRKFFPLAYHKGTAEQTTRDEITFKLNLEPRDSKIFFNSVEMVSKIYPQFKFTLEEREL